MLTETYLASSFFLSNYIYSLFLWGKKQKRSHTPHRKVSFASFLHINKEIKNIIFKSINFVTSIYFIKNKMQKGNRSN